MSDLSEYKDLFVSESQEHLQLMTESALALERDAQSVGEVQESSPALEQLFRSAHTLKGMAAAMGYTDMARVAHALEDLLDAVRHSQLGFTSDHIALCLMSIDVLNAALDAIIADRPPPPELALHLHLLAEIVPRMSGQTGEHTPAQGKLPEEGYAWVVQVTLAADCQLRALRAYMVQQRLQTIGRIVATIPSAADIEAERFDDRFSVALETEASADDVRRVAASVAEVERVEVSAPHPEPAPAPAPRPLPRIEMPTAPPVQATPASARSLRIAVRTLDRLLNLVGELVITRGQLERLGALVANPRLTQALETQARIVEELQATVLTARLVPVSQVFDRFSRMVRDLLVGEGKEAEFVVIGREIEMDRMVLERLGDVLVHILRNAIDHGMEQPYERTARGKPARGELRLSAHRERGFAVIEVSDNGRGMDPERIGQIALARGVVEAHELAQMSPADKLMLICEPNFSTAEQVTDVSGRGVGMAAVKRQVEGLRGVLEITSTAGVGTCFRVRLPVSLAIVPALLVEAGIETYAVPFDFIQRIRAIGSGACWLTALGSGRSLELHTPEGEHMPAFWLHDALAAPARTDSRECYAMITNRGTVPIALVVERVLGKQEIVVKPLPPILQATPYLTGATIVGEGEVVLILDLPQLAAQLW